MQVLFMFPFFLILFSLYKKNKVYLLLILIQIVSYFTQFLVGRYTEDYNLYTFLNIFFVNLNLFLIIAPWRYSRFSFSTVSNNKEFLILKSILYKVLTLNLLLNLIILVIILTYIPDIASFKTEQSFRNLYEQIPYFSNIFRYAYVSQNLGYLAVPIFFYHLSRSEKAESLKALILSCSSLVSGFAFYSRAQIFTFVLVFVIYWFLVKKTVPTSLQIITTKVLKYTAIIIATLFIIITIVRFAAMDYYSDRIPESSIIKNPIIYSLFDYASQGYPNGIKQLQDYSLNKNLNGEQFFRDFYQIFNFFGIMDWDADESQEKINKAYDYDGGAFNGYTCLLVFNFGYIITFFISLTYYLVVYFKLKGRTTVSIESLFVLILLLITPVISIFYSAYSLMIIPLLFLVFVKLFSFVANGK
jgi:oligosaccharide repeat unit polymerase